MRLFFYGTLQASAANPVARSIAPLLRPLGPATVAGTLHAIPDPRGWYPALVTGDGLVHGALLEATPAFSPAMLALVDRYEDYDPAAPDTSLYLRAAVCAVLPGGAELGAEAYRYNQPLPPAARRIASGDFAAWLGAEGAQAYC